jgi:hypothetical protein
MPSRKSSISYEEFLNFDLTPYYTAKKLRRDRPWTYDIIRALWGKPSGRELRLLYRDLWAMRNPVGLAMPKAFAETVRRSIYDHTSQGAGTANPDDDLFFSPTRGTWAVHPACAAVWLKRHDLPDA